MKKQESRVGTFSSSSIYKLVNKGRAKDAVFSSPGLTYIKEKSYEIRLQRQLDNETNSRPTSWGNLLEKRAFDLLPMSLKLESKKRYKHPDLLWTGAPDIVSDTLSGDIKCPFTLKSFCELVDIMATKDTEVFKAEKPEYYYQLVSNSILTGLKTALFAVYVPFEWELNGIRELAENYDGDQNKVAWIGWANDSDLPHLVEDGMFENINTWEFEIPTEDKAYLIERVELANEELLKLLK